MSALSFARPFTTLGLSRISSRIARLASIARSRHGLVHLDDHLLRDIGVTRDQAVAEASRAPWDAPTHWHD